MTKGEETRREIVGAAAALFNQRGYAGCSMGDVMQATGLEKGGIYRHFASKEELAAEALQYAIDSSVRLRIEPEDSVADGLTALRTYVNRFASSPSAVAGGCPLMNAAIDHDDGNAALRAVARDGFARWRERLMVVVKRGKVDRSIRRKADAAWLADTLIATLEGALMLSRLQHSQEPLKHAQRSLQLVLDSIAAER